MIGYRYRMHICVYMYSRQTGQQKSEPRVTKSREQLDGLKPDQDSV
jgi:hypothetical protein